MIGLPKVVSCCQIAPKLQNGNLEALLWLVATRCVFLLSLTPDKTRSQKCNQSVQKSEDSNRDLHSFVFILHEYKAPTMQCPDNRSF